MVPDGVKALKYRNVHTMTGTMYILGTLVPPVANYHIKDGKSSKLCTAIKAHGMAYHPELVVYI